jgi:hypothetical protein
VLDDAFADLPREVQAAESRIPLLERLHDAEALPVVIEAAVGLHEAIQGALARMAERGVSQVVCQGDGLGEILVEAEGAGQRARHLGGLHRVGEPRAVVVALVVDEDLRLVLETPEGGGVDDAVAVALEHHPEGVLRLRMPAPS